MNLQEITQELRSILNDFKRSNLYIAQDALRYVTRSVEVAINLTELAIDNKRAILDSERYWFTGGYFIANAMTGEWEKISILYEKMVEEVKANGFFNSFN